MRTKLEFKGKDVDEAITKACAKMHIAREKLDIEIISTGSSGIFGLCKKKACILVAPKEVAAETKSEASPKAKPETKPKAKAEAKPEAKAKAKAEAKPEAKAKAKAEAKPDPAPSVSDTNEPAAPAASIQPPLPPTKSKPAPQDTDKQDKKVKAAEKTKKPPKREPRRRNQEPPAPLTPEISEQIKTNLGQILSLMNFPSEITIEERENNKTKVHITGDFVEDITNGDGQVLDSLQYLMRKIIGKKFPEKIIFSIDAGGFRERRKTELQELALKLAIEVKEVEKTRTIAPLNPAERRIVHLALQDDKTIRSRSVGEGLFKKILIYLPGKGRSRRRGPRKKKQ